MKKLFLIPLFLLAACAGNPNETPNGDSTASVKETTPEPVTATSTISTANAKEVTTYDNTPESVVMYFYASRIRQDSAWSKVCQAPGERSDRMNNELEQYQKWTMLQYRFIEKQDKGAEKCYIKLWMEINVNGKTDDGEDEATVELIDGKWTITEVPT